MENVQSFINKLHWNDYKVLWSKFWLQKSGFDPNKNGFAKTAIKLPVEEARKRDAALDKEFLEFVKSNFSK